MPNRTLEVKVTGLPAFRSLLERLTHGCEYWDDEAVETVCFFCDVHNDGEAGTDDNGDLKHADDCPWVEARALLGAS